MLSTSRLLSDRRTRGSGAVASRRGEITVHSLVRDGYQVHKAKHSGVVTIKCTLLFHSYLHRPDMFHSILFRARIRTRNRSRRSPSQTHHGEAVESNRVVPLIEYVAPEPLEASSYRTVGSDRIA